MNLLLFTNFDPADIPTNTKMRRIIVYGSVTRYGPQSVAQRGHSVVGPIVWRELWHHSFHFTRQNLREKRLAFFAVNFFPSSFWFRSKIDQPSVDQTLPSLRRSVDEQRRDKNACTERYDSHRRLVNELLSPLRGIIAPARPRVASIAIC